jgi:parallel beta-helix repeat protein
VKRVYRSIILILVLTANICPASIARADTSHCGTISADETWLSTANVHVIECDVIINSNVTLTISSGVIVKFQIGKSLIVDGTLRVLGTSESPVYFTSWRDDAVGGDTNGDGSATTPGKTNWKGIHFRDSSNDANSLIDHAVIRYAGYDYLGNVHLTKASPTIQNTVLTNGHAAIRADVESFPTLTNNTYTENTYNGFYLDGGTIASDALWDILDTSYFVTGDVFIGVGKTLTVDPGVVVKFYLGKTLVIDGTIRALGTSTEPIYFTSWRDDVVGGDTNGDGSATTPGRTNWKGIHFRDSSDDANSLIDYAVIRYAGYDYRGNVHLTKASPTIQNTLLVYGAYGIRSSNSHPTLICNSILNNNGGVYNDTVDDSINLREQWWGSASGPYHPTSNPAGLGNGVSDGVLFAPWLTSPCGTTPISMIRIYLPLTSKP